MMNRTPRPAEDDRYRRIVEHDLSGTVVTNASGEIMFCNQAFAEMFGFASTAEAEGTSILELLRNRQEGAELFERVREHQKTDRFEIEMRTVGGETLWVVARLVAITGDNDEIVELHGYLFNDTKRTRFEEQLIRTQKMESLGTLAGGIAHDFNNILAIVIGYAARLETAGLRPEQRSKAINAIKDAVDRGATLVQHLLTAAQQAEARFGPVDLNALVRETAKMLQATLPKTIGFEFGLDPELPPLNADRSQLQQVLLNLCVNSRDAMPDGGTIRISTGRASSDEVAAHFTGTDANDYAVLRVRDTGEGVSDDVKAHMFEPFFTTKERGKGTGLGLSVVYGVVNNHHGYIRVESEPKGGAEFTVYLPLATSGLTASDGTSTEMDVENDRAPQMILLVEDEEMLRDLGTSFLSDEGYRVIVAADGEEAVRLFEQHCDELGLVICDLGLPRLGGRDAFMKMKEKRPGVRAVVASGYLEPAVRSELLKAGVLDTIQKPYDFRELITKVRSLIGPPRVRDEHPLLF